MISTLVQAQTGLQDAINGLQNVSSAVAAGSTPLTGLAQVDSALTAAKDALTAASAL